MDITSINEYLRFNDDLGLFNLFSPTLTYIDHASNDINLKSFIVEEHHEMRVDLLLRDMYELEPTLVGLYLGNIDIICFINYIDNPLNIKRGMILKYPDIEDFNKFRFTEDSDNFERKANV